MKTEEWIPYRLVPTGTTVRFMGQDFVKIETVNLISKETVNAVTVNPMNGALAYIDQEAAVQLQTPSPESFSEDLSNLRDKYPMCYVDAWTPEDFNMKWDGEEAVDLVQTMEHRFDANNGINWDFIEFCKSEE